MATWTPDQIASVKAFFANKPTPDQIYTAAKQLGLTSEQLADVVSQSVGGNYAQTLAEINAYTSQTGKSLGPTAQATPQVQQPKVQPTVSATKPTYNDPNGLLSRISNIGKPAAQPVSAQPVSAQPVSAQPVQQGQTQDMYRPTQWAPEEINTARDFFRQNPTADMIYSKANELGLSNSQLADLAAQSTGGSYGNTLNEINSYLSQTGKSLAGGYVPIGSVPAQQSQTQTPSPLQTGADPSGIPANMTGMQGTGSINLAPGYVTGLGQNIANTAGGVLNNAMDVYKNWYSNPLTTGVSPEMQTYFDKASTMNPQWSNMVTQAGGLAQASAQYDPAKMQQFVNPYVGAATDAVYSAANRNLNENLLPGVNSTFAGQGQFGSTRSGDFTGRMYRDTQEAASKAAADLQYKGYSAAQDDYQNWAAMGQQAGTNLANIAKLGQGIDQLGLQNLGTAATTQQQLEQQSLDATYKDWLARQQFPMNAVASASGALGQVSNAVGSNKFNIGQTSSNMPTDDTTKIIAALQAVTSAQGQKSLNDILNMF